MIIRSRFPKKHFLHKVYFQTSDNLKRLYRVCKKCDSAVEVENYKEPEKIHELICACRTSDMECCSCETVTECRDKHDCYCCRVVLPKEIEKKKQDDAKLRAEHIKRTEPEIIQYLQEKGDRK